MFQKMSTFWNFDDYIRNPHGKCNQISTNMPSIGLVICEAGFEFLRTLRKQYFFSKVKSSGRVLKCYNTGINHLYVLKVDNMILDILDPI